MRPAQPLPPLRRLALWVMAVALMLAAAVPSGVMPGRGADGALTLVLCTADGPAQVTIDPVTGKPVAAPAERCAWALAQAPVLPTAPLSLAAAAPRAAEPPVAPAVPAPAGAAPAPAPLPRGPPTLS